MSLLNMKPVDLEVSWADLKQSISSMISGVYQPCSNDDWVRLYTSVYKICTNISHPQGETLYFRLRDLLVTHCRNAFQELNYNQAGELQFLKAYGEEFRRYSKGMTYGSELFNYLNRYWIKISHCENGQAPVPGVYPVYELALHVWRDVVFKPFKEKIVEAFLHVIKFSRDTRSLDVEIGNTIVEVVNTYVELGLSKKDPLKLYREELEVHFVTDTCNYYAGIATAYVQSLTVSEYLKQAEELCQEEQMRCEGRMHRITVEKTRQACFRVLIEDYAEYLCAEVTPFLETGDTTNLRRLFFLLLQLENDAALTELRQRFRQHVEKEGLSVVNQFTEEEAFENPGEYVDRLLCVYQKYYTMIESAFDLHQLMRTALGRACGVFINSNRRLPELLAKYANQIMDKQPHPNRHSNITASLSKQQIFSSNSDNNEVEERITSVGKIFSLVEDKDVFNKFYAKLLAKRLIRATSASDDNELFMIQQLRDICGGEFVSKLQRMFSDRDLSKSINYKFKLWLNHYHANEQHSVPLSVMVLTAGSWPIETPKSEIILPPELSRCVDLFAQFYAINSTGRRLQWAFDLSTGDVVTTCFERRYEFVLNAYQIVILLLFNDHDVLTKSQIEASTKISDTELQRQIAGLVLAKILLCSDDQDAVYQLNRNFHSKRSKLRIASTVLVETPQENAVTHREITDDRKMVVQAAIVRVMKTRGQLSHTLLVGEVLSVLQSKFVPAVSVIKQNIETLIDKEYIKRVDGANSTYMYIA